jgi:pimeloyl-ACP methyl ester carboxylesterase
MTKESELRYETFIKDAEGWISMLKADKRFSKVEVLGHSEGSLIGMLAAEKYPIGGLISISGPGKPADLILQQQLKTQLPPSLLMESIRILTSLKAGKTVNDVDPNLMAMYRPSIQPYMISWIKYDPAKEIKKLKTPVLIIQGTTDLQVTVDDAKLLAAARPDAKLLIVEKMNHVMKEADANVTNNMATYKNPTLPLKTGLLDDIVNFIKAQK